MSYFVQRSSARVHALIIVLGNRELQNNEILWGPGQGEEGVSPGLSVFNVGLAPYHFKHSKVELWDTV